MPGVLTAAQLAFLQTKATATLDLSANTTRNTAGATATDAYGNPTETWTAVLTNVACGEGPTTPAMQQLYPEAFIGSVRTAHFAFPIGSDVKRGDRITTGGRTYRVAVRLDPQSYPTLVVVIATQIDEVIN